MQHTAGNMHGQLPTDGGQYVHAQGREREQGKANLSLHTSSNALGREGCGQTSHCHLSCLHTLPAPQELQGQSELCKARPRSKPTVAPTNKPRKHNARTTTC